MSNNKISGTIPKAYENATDLIDLYLDNNNLTGLIPDVSSSSLPNITEILLNGNFLSGSVPFGLCDLRDSFPGQFITLKSDCKPSPNSDVARNPCRNNCCTD